MGNELTLPTFTVISLSCFLILSKEDVIKSTPISFLYPNLRRKNNHLPSPQPPSNTTLSLFELFFIINIGVLFETYSLLYETYSFLCEFALAIANGHGHGMHGRKAAGLRPDRRLQGKSAG